jgi:hypothetical protein
VRPSRLRRGCVAAQLWRAAGGSGRSRRRPTGDWSACSTASSGSPTGSAVDGEAESVKWGSMSASASARSATAPKLNGGHQSRDEHCHSPRGSWGCPKTSRVAEVIRLRALRRTRSHAFRVEWAPQTVSVNLPPSSGTWTRRSMTAANHGCCDWAAYSPNPPLLGLADTWSGAQRGPEAELELGCGRLIPCQGLHPRKAKWPSSFRCATERSHTFRPGGDRRRRHLRATRRRAARFRAGRRLRHRSARPVPPTRTSESRAPRRPGP